MNNGFTSGHNGAGKSTLVACLTGLVPLTKGRVTINGLDLEKDMDEIRCNIGICPQHNVLFDELTVVEHLEMYAVIKGVPSPLVAQEVQKMVKLIDLSDKKGTQSKDLSGGMKRKLCVGIAIIGTFIGLKLIGYSYIRDMNLFILPTTHPD